MCSRSLMPYTRATLSCSVYTTTVLEVPLHDNITPYCQLRLYCFKQMINTSEDKVNGGNSGQWVTSDSDSSCSESAAADTSADKGCFMRRWGSFPSGGGVGGGRFAARTVAVRSYPLSGVPPIYLIQLFWIPCPRGDTF